MKEFTLSEKRELRGLATGLIPDAQVPGELKAKLDPKIAFFRENL